MENIGQRIKQVREAQHLTQQEFGIKIGVTKQAIANIENGRCNPSIPILGELVLKLNVNVNWLLTGIGNTFTVQNNAQQDDQLENLVAKIVDKKMKERGL